MLFGAFTYGGVWGGTQPIVELERRLGHRLDIVHWFARIEEPFDTRLLAAAAADGRRPMVTLEMTSWSLDSVADGRHDATLRHWARAVRSHGDRVYLRPWPEMNGSWTPWSGDPAAFVSAWRHVVDLFRAEGADGAVWVWAPNVTDEPAVSANRLERYYPGHAYVDVLGVDGYNWGAAHGPEGWSSFADIFEPVWPRLLAVGPQPIWITEVGSAERGGDKADWIAGMAERLDLERLGAIVWFDQNKEANWRIDSSRSTLAAFQQALTRWP